MSGVQNIPIRIPAQWDPNWFEIFIREVLAKLDVRNARGTGIEVGGGPDEFATLNASYSEVLTQSFVVVGLSGELPGERQLNAETDVLVLTDAGAESTLTISLAANGVTNAKLRQSSGLSIIGRSADSTGNVADITAASDGGVLRRSGTTLGFGDIPQSSVTDLVTALAAKVPGTRNINTNAPLTGGGALTGDLTLDIDEATTSVPGVVLQGASVADLGQTISDPPTQAEVQAISDKIDELLAALRTAGLLAA